jgi:hypothetical protein
VKDVLRVWMNERDWSDSEEVKSGYAFGHSVIYKIWTDDEGTVHREAIDPADFYDIKDRQPTSAKEGIK